MPRSKPNTECSIDGCIRLVSAKGMCGGCYNKNRMKDPSIAEQVKINNRKAVEKYRATTNKIEMSSRNRKYHLKMTYGLTPEEYDRQLESQNGLCAICKSERIITSKYFAIDHDHTCCPGTKSCGECFRGILCAKCNKGIGLLNDDVELLQRAIDYINDGGIWN